MAYVRCSNGGGTSTLKDVYYNIIFNGGHTAYTLTPYSSRCTLSEGGIAVDTTNHTVYLYADFTVNQNLSSSSAFTMIETDMPNTYMPYVYSGTSLTRGYATLTVDNNSTVPTKSMTVNNLSGTVSVLRASGQGASINDHYIIYGSWKY